MNQPNASMRPPPSGEDAPEGTLDAVIADYLQALERGDNPDRAKWLAGHPQHADALRSFFAGQDDLAAIATGVPPGAGTPCDGPPASGAGASASANAVTIDGVLHEPPDPLPGEHIRYFGDYELVQEIARGGMGVVYEARQLSLNRSVALKMILAGALATEAEITRFHQEAESAASLDHPHIVPIHEVGQYKGRHYFTMKLIEGGPLSDHQARLKRDLRAAATLMAKVARAVHFAHQRGILHRDLKPANILLDARGEPHITDFGLAKRVDATDAGLTLTIPGGIVGTPAYMPPEQARGVKQLTIAADVYSLGAILYVLLTGEPPFRAKTPLDTMRKLIDEEPAAPRSLDARVPADLQTICLKCLEKDPARRYRSAEELADELQRWLRHEPIRARPVSSSERIVKWVRRHPAASVAAVIMLALAVALVWAGAVAWRSAEQRAAAVQDLDTARASLAGIQTQVGQKTTQLTATQNELASSQANLANVYDSIKIARESLQDSKSRLLFEQARARRLAGAPGWRDEAMSMLKDAEHLRARPRPALPASTPHVDAGDPLPERWELRSEAAAVMLSRDARVVTELATMPGFGVVAGFSADGRIAVTPWIGVENLGDLARVDPNKPPPAGLRVLDTLEGREISRFGDLTNVEMYPGASIIAPDGKQFISMMDGVIRIWSLPDGREVDTLQTPEAADGARLIAYAFAFRGDGKELAALCGKEPSAQHEAQLVVWTLPDPKPRTILTYPCEGSISNRTLEYSKSGDRLLVSIAQQKLALIEARDGKLVKELSLGRPLVGPATLSPDGRSAHVPLAAANAGDMMGRSGVDNVLWNVASNELRRKLTTLTSIAALNNAAAFSPDGRTIAVTDGSDGLAFFDVFTGRQLWQLPGAHRGVQRLQWTPDGEHLVVAGFDGLLRRWALSPELSIRTISGELTAQMVSVSPDGKWLAILESLALQDAPVHLMEVRTGNYTVMPGGIPAFSPDSSRIGFERVFPARGLTAYTLADGKKVTDYQGLLENSPLLGPVRPGFTTDGRLLAMRKKDDNFELWDGPADKVIASIPAAPNTVAALFVGDGRTLLRGLSDRGSTRVQAWDWVENREVLSLALPKGAVPVYIGMSRDRRSLLAVTLMMDIAGAQHLRTPDILASLTGSRAVAMLSPAKAGDEPIQLATAGFINSAAFSPDGRMAAIMERGGRLGLFEVATGAPILSVQIPLITHDTQIEFTPDGTRLILVETNMPVRMLDLSDLRLDLATLGLDW